LMYNVCISSDQGGKPIEYPDASVSLPDPYAQLMYQMSSVLPPSALSVAELDGYVVTQSSRGFLFQADPVALIRFLDIGTRPTNLR
jgi:hypothetical protein